MEKKIKEGYNRIRVKTKELRSGYKTAVDKGRRSGSGRLVHEHFDLLTEIWGGSPAVDAMETGISTHESETNIECEEAEHEFESNNDENIESNQGNDGIQEANSIVRNVKRDKMRKKLSSHQRDMMHLDIMKKELELKKKAIDILGESAKANENNMKLVSDSISEIGKSIKDGMSILANAMIQCQQISMPHQYINMGQLGQIYQPSSNSQFISPPRTPRGSTSNVANTPTSN